MNGSKAMTWLVFEHDSPIQLLTQFHARENERLCPKYKKNYQNNLKNIPQLILKMILNEFCSFFLSNIVVNWTVVYEKK